MKTTLTLAAQTYASLNPSYKNSKEVLEAIKEGNQTVRDSVVMLMFSAA